MADNDADGFASPEDCDDGRADVYPGAPEVPYDGVDQDCDGFDAADLDGDGWDGEPAGGADCDDADAESHPDALEVCGDLRDNDCDGAIDGGCPGTASDGEGPGGITWVCGPPVAPVSGVVLLAAFLAARRGRRP